MFQYDVQIRVRYADTDQMGYVYYGNYASFYEIARVEAFRSIGYSYKKLEDGGIGMPVVEMKTNYHYPARYDDLLTVTVKVPEMPRARIRYEYEIHNQGGKLVNSGETTLVFMNMESGRPVRMPEEMKTLIAKYFD